MLSFYKLSIFKIVVRGEDLISMGILFVRESLIKNTTHFKPICGLQIILIRIDFAVDSTDLSTWGIRSRRSDCCASDHSKMHVGGYSQLILPQIARCEKDTL